MRDVESALRSLVTFTSLTLAPFSRTSRLLFIHPNIMSQTRSPGGNAVPRKNDQLKRFVNLSVAILVISTLLVLGGCGKSAGGNAVHVKSATTGEKDLAIKSGYALPVTKSFTDVNNKITTASAYYVYLANYDLDAKNFAMTLD